ncbi:MAG: VOC family protein [Candidatus Thorarchaeota archaeon]
MIVFFNKKATRDVGLIDVVGIIFFKTRMLDRIVQFYVSKVGMTIWLEQKDCIILQFDNMLMGFCQRETSETEGVISFDFDEKERVDEMYEQFKDLAVDPPSVFDKYRIYQFFAKDPEGRIIEFQSFLDKMKPV